MGNGFNPVVAWLSQRNRAWEPLGLIKDSSKNLWCFGDKMFGLFDLNQLSATTSGEPVVFE
jgi:hypothetical protein